MFSTNTKLKPFNSDPVKVERQGICAVTFGSNSVPVKWQIIAAECESILAGNSDPKGEIQGSLAEYSHNFRGIGKLKNHQIKLHVNTEVKPVATPPCSVPYHLKEQVSRVIQEMINQDIIEEHTINQSTPWVSNPVIAPKTDGSIKMPLDARNVNKASIPTNHPTPRHDDIKAKFA